MIAVGTGGLVDVDTVDVGGLLDGGVLDGFVEDGFVGRVDGGVLDGLIGVVLVGEVLTEIDVGGGRAVSGPPSCGTTTAVPAASMIATANPAPSGLSR